MASSRPSRPFATPHSSTVCPSRCALWRSAFCSELGKPGGDSIEEGIKAEFEDLVASERDPSLEEASKTRVRCAEHVRDVSADVLA